MNFSNSMSALKVLNPLLSKVYSTRTINTSSSLRIHAYPPAFQQFSTLLNSKMAAQASKLIFFILLSSVFGSQAALNAHYYDQTCPQAEFIVAQTVRNASIYDPKVPARLLRMFFHDCFIRVSIF